MLVISSYFLKSDSLPMMYCLIGNVEAIGDNLSRRWKYKLFSYSMVWTLF